MADEKRRHAARPAHAAPRTGSRVRTSAGAGEGISTIRSGQGARVTTRKNAAEVADKARKKAEKRYFERHPEAKASDVGPARSGRNVVLLVIMAILALAIVFVVGSCVTGLVSGSGEKDDAPTQTLQLTEQEQQLQEQQQANDAGSEQVAVGDSVHYAGDAYALVQGDDGTWELVCTSASGASSTLFLIEGEPIALARMADTILIPENRGDGWDVVCYVINGQGSATYVVDESGSVAGGEGEATSSELQGTSIVVTDAAGVAHEVSLV